MIDVSQRGAPNFPPIPSDQGFFAGESVSFEYDGADLNPIPWLIPVPAGNGRLFSLQATLFGVGDEAIVGRSQSIIAFIFATFWRSTAGVLEGVGGPSIAAFPPVSQGTGGGSWVVLAAPFSGQNLVVEIYPNSGTPNNAIRAQGVLTAFTPPFALGISG